MLGLKRERMGPLLGEEWSLVSHPLDDLGIWVSVMISLGTQIPERDMVQQCTRWILFLNLLFCQGVNSIDTALSWDDLDVAAGSWNVDQIIRGGGRRWHLQWTPDSRRGKGEIRRLRVALSFQRSTDCWLSRTSVALNPLFRHPIIMRPSQVRRK